MCQDAIRLENISFTYEDRKIIDSLSLRVSKGEHVGILGDSGCGKSTLLKILAGLYGPDCGKAVIAGESVPKKIREHVAMVMQQASLFPMSIRDNISCGHDIAEEKIWAACESASIEKWVRSLPKGLDANVGERGNQVSGGQAQRIQIARAFCKDAPIILLDEPVSALDKETVHSVLRALRRLTDGRTVVHVTHHPETLEDEDTIYRMEGGRLFRV